MSDLEANPGSPRRSWQAPMLEQLSVDLNAISNSNKPDTDGQGNSASTKKS